MKLKKKTGVVIDGYGNKIDKMDKEKINENNPNQLLLHTKENTKLVPPPNDKFKVINAYTPSGNLIYNQDLFKKIEDRSKK